jgi:predicted cobalt transporter CbtA
MLIELGQLLWVVVVGIAMLIVVPHVIGWLDDNL